MIENKLISINNQSSKENFWKDQKVKVVLKQKNFFESLISKYKKFKEEIKNIDDLYKLGSEEKNHEVIDCEEKLKTY